MVYLNSIEFADRCKCAARIHWFLATIRSIRDRWSDEIRNYAIAAASGRLSIRDFSFGLHARVETCDLQVKLIIADDRCERNGRRDELLRATSKRRVRINSRRLLQRGKARRWISVEISGILLPIWIAKGKSESSTERNDGCQDRYFIAPNSSCNSCGNTYSLECWNFQRQKAYAHMCYLHFTNFRYFGRGIYLKRLRSVA